jgi:superfamily II DNA or RNA helicase
MGSRVSDLLSASRSARSRIQDPVAATSLDAAIADARNRVEELDRLRTAAAERLLELTRLRGAQPDRGGPNGGTEYSPAAKLRIFRELFAGRDDVFAVRWDNSAQNRAGYSPRCANEWQRGVCGKPKVKCGACGNQAFLTLDDRQLLAHLQGRQVVGLYPLLLGDRCRLLAIDLDGSSWRTDVKAISNTCRSLGIEPAIERSRSGDGAHVWFFFTETLPAAEARRLGFTILTRTMAAGAALGVDSYDRLFPSQDVLPTGGFGNLIALPLQREARKAHNTEFLDAELEPHRDQWAYLASIPRITREHLSELLASDDDVTLAGGPNDDGRDAPWRPPRMLRQRLTDVSLPVSLTVTIADRLYVERAAVPPALAHAIRCLAMFSNPMFMELQRMRMSVARTPRVIACFNDLGGHLALPRGCLADLEALLDDVGVQLELRDERVDGEPLTVAFQGELSSSQREAADGLLRHQTGVLSAPPGWGKTVLATSLIAARGRSTLVLVHRKPLVDQWAERLAEFLAVSPKSIGKVGGGRNRVTQQLDIAMVQTLARKDDLAEFLRAYGHVIIDECHHVPAVSVERVLSAVPARYVTGLTATPYRRDGHQPIIAMQCGPVRLTVKAAAAQTDKRLELTVVRRGTNFDPTGLPAGASIQEIYGALASDGDRLELIVADTENLVGEGRAPVILTERREHVERLTESLRGSIPNLVVLHGGLKPKERRDALQQLADLNEGDPRLLVATGRYLGEGFDDPRLDTLLLAMPIAWKGTVVQYAGRLHRAHPGKRDIRIYDYVDADVPVLRRMYAKRLSAYQGMGYNTDAQFDLITR